MEHQLASLFLTYVGLEVDKEFELLIYYEWKLQKGL